MPSPYYRFLNLPFAFFDQTALSNEQVIGLNLFRNKHWDHLDYVFNKSAVDFFRSFKFKLINAELFYTPPLGMLPWHTDMNPPEDFMKINFVWGSDDHLMLWGEMKDPNRRYATSKTEVNSQYIGLFDDQVNLTESATIDKPAIVNVGRPHKIINRDNKGRWCLSAILTLDSKRILFEDAVDIFNEYVEDYR